MTFFLHAVSCPCVCVAHSLGPDVPPQEEDHPQRPETREHRAAAGGEEGEFTGYGSPTGGDHASPRLRIITQSTHTLK